MSGKSANINGFRIKKSRKQNLNNKILFEVTVLGNDRYDCIVVGAGPAGIGAALTMARQNLSVLLIERGDFPGSKNMFGGSIHSGPVEELIPAFWEKAPLERVLVSDELWFLGFESAVKMGFTGLRFGKAPYNKFSALRPKFDLYMSKEAEKAGARLLTKTLVRDIVYKKTGLLNKKVDGVLLDDGTVIYADAVILAEGAQGALTEKIGLRGPLKTNLFTHYCIEILALSPDKINSRFNLEKNEGTNIGMIGFPAGGASGKGGIWTNKDSITIVVGAYLNQINDTAQNPFQLLERFKNNALVNRLIQGSEPIEFASKTIPKGGYKYMPKLYIDGLLVSGDAAMMISGRRGLDLALLTGKYAGETVVQAHAKGDYSATILKSYQTKLMNSFFMTNLKAGQDISEYFLENSDADFVVNKALNKAAYEFFKADMTTSEEKHKEIRKELKTIQPLNKSLKDIIQAYLHWGVF